MRWIAPILLLTGCIIDVPPFPEFFPEDWGDARFDTEPAVLDWAHRASAPRVHDQVLLPWTVLQADPDRTCPALEIVDGDEEWTADGCTDADGITWEGELTYYPGEEPQLLYDGLSMGFTNNCVGEDRSGTVRFIGQVVLSGDETDREMSALLVERESEGFEGCPELAPDLVWLYSARVRIDEAGVETWEGGGTLGSSEVGVLDATTTDLVLDPAACDTEAASGETVLATDAHEAVIVYDGAEDCDPESTVTWSYDGEDRGEIAGVPRAAGR